MKRVIGIILASGLFVGFTIAFILLAMTIGYSVGISVIIILAIYVGSAVFVGLIFLITWLLQG